MRARRLLKSAGFRFALLHTLVFVLAVSVIGWAAEVTVTSALERQAKDRIEAETASLMAEYRRRGLDGLRAAIDERTSAVQRRLQYAVVDGQGRVVAGDRALAAWAAAAPADSVTLTQRPGKVFDNLLLASRSLEGGVRLVMVDDLESVDDIEDVVLNAFLVALALAIVLGLGAGAFFTRSLLRRVDGVTRTAEAIIGGDLSRRIALVGSGDDFDRLSTTLNTMLDKISGLLENLRQVTNDIAHDLRTPLAHLRQQLENVRTDAAASAECQLGIDHAIASADALLNTFSALLRVAEIEAGARRSSFRALDLSAVVRTVAEAYGPVFEDGGRVLKTDIPEQLSAFGDGDLLIQMFANLMENVLRHTPKGTGAVMRLVDAGSHVLAEVSDDGPGIPEQERSRVLRRFYRLEHSRTTPGNGLGLSLVAAIADLHGATLELSDNRPGLKIAMRLLADAKLAQSCGHGSAPNIGRRSP